MSTSETITRTDLTNILNEVLPTPPLNELIYSGSFTTGTTSLQKSVANYVKILIVYEDNDSTTHTKSVITNKASAFTTACSILRVTGLDYKKCMIVSFNGTFMNVECNKQGAGTATPTDGSYITIKKIYGVKAIDSDAIADQADYVIEQGTSGIWTYRKWNSGIAECWGVTDVASTTYSGAGSYKGVSENLPSGLFNVTPPVVIACGKIADVIQTDIGYTQANNTTTIQTYLISRYSSSVTKTGQVFWNVKGTWK